MVSVQSAFLVNLGLLVVCLVLLSLESMSIVKFTVLNVMQNTKRQEIPQKYMFKKQKHTLRSTNHSQELLMSYRQFHKAMIPICDSKKFLISTETAGRS